MEPLPALIEHFQDLDDPRIERCKLHKLIDIVFIAICAVVSGAEGWKDIEAFAQVKQPWLRRYLELPNGLPSDDTFRRVIARIKPTQFEACLRRWIETVLELRRFDGTPPCFFGRYCCAGCGVLDRGCC